MYKYVNTYIHPLFCSSREPWWKQIPDELRLSGQKALSLIQLLASHGPMSKFLRLFRMPATTLGNAELIRFIRGLNG